jgi:hypothetical protein
MRHLLFATLGVLVLFTGTVQAQIGGSGVARPTSSTLGYVQFVTPPPSANALSATNVCRNWPFPSFTQPVNLVGGYAIINDPSGHPHYMPGC